MTKPKKLTFSDVALGLILLLALAGSILVTIHTVYGWATQ